MDQLRGICLRVREYRRGQTMTEYALILAAIAVVCIIGYDAMGTSVSAVVTSVNAQL